MGWKVVATSDCTGKGAREQELSAEVLGDAFGKVYTSEATARLVAKELQESVAEFGLLPSTRYEVEEVTEEFDTTKAQQVDVTATFPAASADNLIKVKP